MTGERKRTGYEGQYDGRRMKGCSLPLFLRRLSSVMRPIGAAMPWLAAEDWPQVGREAP
jgi:hypothetical protein